MIPSLLHLSKARKARLPQARHPPLLLVQPVVPLPLQARRSQVAVHLAVVMALHASQSEGKDIKNKRLPNFGASLFFEKSVLFGLGLKINPYICPQNKFIT